MNGSRPKFTYILPLNVTIEDSSYLARKSIKGPESRQIIGK